jgi:hypothetical protein
VRRSVQPTCYRRIGALYSVELLVVAHAQISRFGAGEYLAMFRVVSRLCHPIAYVGAVCVTVGFGCPFLAAGRAEESDFAP